MYRIRAAAAVGLMALALVSVLSGAPASANVGAKPLPPEPPLTTQYTCWATPDAYCPLNPYQTRYITPPNGQQDRIIASGNSTAYVGGQNGFDGCRVDYQNSTSQVAWWGDSPYNADYITHTDVWDTDYGAISISISNAPSGSVNKGNGRVEWATNTTNDWRSYHDWDSIRMTTCGLGRITGVNFNVFGTFKFGAISYGVSAYDGAGIVR